MEVTLLNSMSLSNIFMIVTIFILIIILYLRYTTFNSENFGDPATIAGTLSKSQLQNLCIRKGKNLGYTGITLNKFVYSCMNKNSGLLKPIVRSNPINIIPGTIGPYIPGSSSSILFSQGDPCSEFSGSSTNISSDCYAKVWRDAGCTNMSFIKGINQAAWADGQTLDTLRGDSQTWASMTDDYHRSGCYGKNKKNWPGYVAPPPPPPVTNMSLPNVFNNIKITTTQDSVVNLGELYAFDINGNIIDLLDYSDITQSTYFDQNAFPATNLIDGDENTFNHTLGGVGQWVNLALTVPIQISALVVVNRVDCCQERAQGLQITLSGPNGQNSSIQLPNIIQMRYNIAIDGNGNTTYITPQSATIQPTYGSSNNFNNIRITTTQSSFVNLGELYAYDQSGAKIDLLALTSNTSENKGENITQINYLIQDLFKATNLVDGNIDTFNHTNVNAAGNNGIVGAWVNLALNTSVNISRITVVNRQDCCQDRAQGLIITLSGPNGNISSSQIPYMIQPYYNISITNDGVTTLS